MSGGIEIGEPIVFLAIANADVPAKADINRQLSRDFPVVLDISGVVEHPASR